MRRCLVLALVFLLAACDAESGEGTTTSTRPAATSSTTLASAPTTTSSMATTTTALPTTTTTTISLDETTLAYEAVGDLPFPVQMTARPGEALAYLITKDGRVWVFDGAAVAPEPVLDISGQVRDSGEQGLLSVALHPTDPRLYLHYSDNDGDTVVSEFALPSPTEADPGSERVLLQVDQPAGNHNGGMIQFTPAGTLLLGLGDGGGADDTFGNGQDPETLLAGLVELRVDGDPSPAKYAMGLRNPWRFWIDGETVYIADVGQDEFEEIDVVPLQPGLNFGWPLFEAAHCFNSPDCDTTGLVMPVREVRHGDEGTCSITGGMVYRGSALPQLRGHYFFSDYCGGYLRSLHYVDGSAGDSRDWTGQVGVPGPVTGFGIDGTGEMYVTTTAQLLRLVSGR
jgi:glucose/arabinose dehydrogenase